MIRTQKLVPEIYTEKSRDFQVLCRLTDFLFNSTQYNINTMSNLTNTRGVKDNLLPLVGDKFGIYDKEACMNRNLLEALPGAQRNKGSLKAVVTLVNAFLDSMGIFNFATIYAATNKESADEISEILNRPVKNYSLIIILDAMPSLVNLNILDIYLKMVIPTGMIIDYYFGYSKTILDKYRYREFVLLTYTNWYTQPSSITSPVSVVYDATSNIMNKDDKYRVTSSTFDQQIEEDELLTANEKHFVRSAVADIKINTVETEKVGDSKSIQNIYTPDSEVGNEE